MCDESSSLPPIEILRMRIDLTLCFFVDMYRQIGFGFMDNLVSKPKALYRTEPSPVFLIPMTNVHVLRATPFFGR